MTRTIAVVCCLLPIWSCGGANAATTTEPTARAEVVEAPPPRPTYVIVHRNTPIRLQPDEDAPFLQYRTPERQADFDKRLRKEAEQRDEKEAEAAEKRADKAKKRKDKLRKRWRRYSRKRRGELWEKERERVEERNVKQAERELRAIRNRAKKHPLRESDRAWIPFQLVERKGGWLRLSPVDRDAERSHCYLNNFGEVDRLSATFWVKDTQLEQVTTKSVTVAPEHGTQVIVRPGVAVRPIRSDETDLYEVFVDGFRLKLKVPADAVGTEYEPARPFEAPMTDTTFTPYAYTKRLLRLGPGQTLEYNPTRQMYVTGTLYIGSKFYATTQTPCGEYTLRSKEEAIEPVGKRGVMRLSADGEAITPPLARAGATAFLPDGSKFALIRQDFPLGEPTKTSGGRGCYRSAVWGDEDAAVSRGLELCFDAGDIELPEEK